MMQTEYKCSWIKYDKKITQEKQKDRQKLNLDGGHSHLQTPQKLQEQQDLTSCQVQIANERSYTFNHSAIMMTVRNKKMRIEEINRTEKNKTKG